MVDIVVFVYCMDYTALLQALSVGTMVVIVQQTEEGLGSLQRNFGSPLKQHSMHFPFQISEILDATQCTYSVGLIQGTVNVRDPCNRFLSSLLATEETLGEEKKELVREFLESNFGANTVHNWEMPQNARVFCAMPNHEHV